MTSGGGVKDGVEYVAFIQTVRVRELSGQIPLTGGPSTVGWYGDPVQTATRFVLGADTLVSGTARCHRFDPTSQEAGDDKMAQH
ncbi:hypothetical protein M1D51_11980 [Arthrobacter sp. R3-55]